MIRTARDVARDLSKMDKGDHIAEFGPKILELMRGVPWAVFIELDEKPGRFGYMNDRFYMLRQVRNDQFFGRQMFDGLTERGKGVTPKRRRKT